MSSGKINIGLVGLGDMGMAHLLCLQSFSNVAVTALCELNEDRLKQGLLHLGGRSKPYYDYKNLLRHEMLDAVFVSVPNFLHAEIGLAVLEAEKHLFLEKPLADSSKNAKKLLKAAKKKGRVFHCGHIYRSSPFYIEMADWIQRGAIGKPMLLWCHEFRQPFPQREWYYDKSKTGGTFVEKDCHHFDLFNWITQDKPSRVAAFAGQAVLKPGREIACSYCPDPPKKLVSNNTVDHGWVTIEYQKGAKANLGLCMFLQSPDRIWRGLELGVIGDSGKMIVANVDFETMTLFGKEKKEETKTVKNPYQGKWHSGMREEHDAFLKAVETGGKNIETVEWGYEAVRIAEAAEIAAAKGKIISL